MSVRKSAVIAVSVIACILALNPNDSIMGILVSVILTVAVSLADKEPDKEVLKMFDKAQHEVKSIE